MSITKRSMNLSRSMIPVGFTVFAFSACTGSMGSGATPPLSGPAPGAPLQQQAAASAPLPAHAQSTPIPLSAQSTVAVVSPGVFTLPAAAGFSGFVCLAPENAASATCAGNTATAAPTSGASPTPTASVPPRTVLITPPPKRSIASGVHLVLLAYPTAAPLRDDPADDGATVPLAVVDLVPSINVTLPGLNAFTLTLPALQASAEHHYALALYDRGQKTGSHGFSNVLHHGKTILHASALAVSAQLTGNTLVFVDNATAISLTAKDRYSVVLYSDTVTPTPAPSIEPAPIAAPTATAVATGAPGALATPYSTYTSAAGTPPFPISSPSH